MNLMNLLNNGAVLRYREKLGFYAVKEGKSFPIAQAEAEKAIKARKVRPESQGPDKFGVWHFARV